MHGLLHSQTNSGEMPPTPDPASSSPEENTQLSGLKKLTPEIIEQITDPKEREDLIDFIQQEEVWYSDNPEMKEKVKENSQNMGEFSKTLNEEDMYAVMGCVVDGSRSVEWLREINVIFNFKYSTKCPIHQPLFKQELLPFLYKTTAIINNEGNLTEDSEDVFASFRYKEEQSRRRVNNITKKIHSFKRLTNEALEIFKESVAKKPEINYWNFFFLTEEQISNLGDLLLFGNAFIISVQIIVNGNRVTRLALALMSYPAWCEFLKAIYGKDAVLPLPTLGKNSKEVYEEERLHPQSETLFSSNDQNELTAFPSKRMACFFPGTYKAPNQLTESLHDLLHAFAASETPTEVRPAVFYVKELLRSYLGEQFSYEIWLIVANFFVRSRHIFSESLNEYVEELEPCYFQPEEIFANIMNDVFCTARNRCDEKGYIRHSLIFLNLVARVAVIHEKEWKAKFGFSTNLFDSNLQPPRQPGKNHFYAACHQARMSKNFFSNKDSFITLPILTRNEEISVDLIKSSFFSGYINSSPLSFDLKVIPFHILINYMASNKIFEETLSPKKIKKPKTNTIGLFFKEKTIPYTILPAEIFPTLELLGLGIPSEIKITTPLLTLALTLKEYALQNNIFPTLLNLCLIVLAQNIQVHASNDNSMPTSYTLNGRPLDTEKSLFDQLSSKNREDNTVNETDNETKLEQTTSQIDSIQVNQWRRLGRR